MLDDAKKSKKLLDYCPKMWEIVHKIKEIPTIYRTATFLVELLKLVVIHPIRFTIVLNRGVSDFGTVSL